MIRVLRVLEYEYDSLTTYEEDKVNWTHEINVGGGPFAKSHKIKRMASQVVRVHEIEETT